MVVVTIWDVLIIGIIGLIIIWCFISAIVDTIKNVGKKNCYECKYYKLDDVASCGDCCWYRCTKHKRKDNGVSMNEKYHFEKCKDFKPEKGK